MHICFASLDYPTKNGGGGVGTYVQTLGRELVKKGHKVTVVALKSADGPNWTEDEGVKVCWASQGNIHWYASKLPFVGRILALPIREIEYSKMLFRCIVEIHRKEPIDLIEGIERGAYFLNRARLGIKTVIRLHGDVYTFFKYTPPRRIPMNVRLTRYLQRRSLLRADLLTSPSRTHATEIISELKGRRSDIKVTPNPVSVDSRCYTVTRHAKDAGSPLFLFVGRLERRKGVIPLLKAIPTVLSKLPDAKFVFAGNRHPSVPWEEIEFLVNELGIKKSVVFPGHVDAEKLRSFYASADVVVLPSFYETFGYVYIEALQFCKPVAASNAGAVNDLITNGKNGLLVPPGDSAALADACVRALSLRVESPDREFFDRYSPERVYNEMLGVYDELLRGNSEHNAKGSPEKSAPNSPSSADIISYGPAAAVTFNIFLSPHSDDAVFSCGGIMHEYAKHGKNNLVITLFGGKPDISALSPFAREIHEKWKVADPISLRMSEDMKALETIGAEKIHLDFPDCIYRKTKEGIPLYNDYERMKGTLHPQDQELCDDIYEKVKEIVQRYDPESAQILVPLGIGNHVDHQIAHKVGTRLIAEGFKIFFYEEFPYCMWYPEQLKAIGATHDNRLSPLVVPVDIKAKLLLMKHYSSQLSGIGGNYRKASKHFKKYALTVGNGTYAERIWLSTIRYNK